MVVLMKASSAAVPPHDYAPVYHKQHKPSSTSTSTRHGTTRARPSAWERVQSAVPISTSQPSWEAPLRPRSPPPWTMTSHQQEHEARWQQRQQRHHHLYRQPFEDGEDGEDHQPLPPSSSLASTAPSSPCPPLFTTSPPRIRHPSPPTPVTRTHNAPFSSSLPCSFSSFAQHLAPLPSPPSSSPSRSPGLQNATAAFQRLSRLRAQTEDAFQKLLTDLPVLEPYPSPSPALAPLTPAFDLVALKRQVGALQDELALRYTHQEGMHRQNVKLWELLRAVCDTPSWTAAEGEINLVHAALRERQAEVETLQHSLKESQTVKVRLFAVRAEREKARVNLKVAQEGKAEASRVLAAVMADNQALEEELEEQTAAMQDLQRYLANCQATQQEEHLEDLGEVAARFYASPSSVFALRRRREAFALLRLAAHRSRRLRELGMRFQEAGIKVLAHKALASLAQHRWLAQYCRRVQKRQDAVLLRFFWGAWHRYTKQELFFKLSARRRLLRWCLTGWRKVAAEGQRHKRLKAQMQKLRDRRLLRGLFEGWHQLTSYATATGREGMDKAAVAWKQRAWKVFGRRLEQQRAVLQTKDAALVAQQNRRRLREGWRVWVLQCKVARFEGLMLERHPQRAPTTLAQCLVTWAAWARHRRVIMRAAVTKGERQWEARMVARAVQALAQHARVERRVRAAERKGNKARIFRATRQALLLQWLPRVEAWRARRVLVAKGILTRRRHALRRVLLLWAGWTRRERETRSWAWPHRPGSRLHELGVAMERWKVLVARRAREREGRREGRVVARRWQRRHKAHAFRQWRDTTLGYGHSGSGCDVGGIRRGRQEGPQTRALLQQAFNDVVCDTGAATTTRDGGREWRNGEGVVSSNSDFLLQEIDNLTAQVKAAERYLEAKVLAATTAAAVIAVGAPEKLLEEESEVEQDAASTIAYLQQQLSAFKGQEDMLRVQQRSAEGRPCALQERLGHHKPSSSSSSSSSYSSYSSSSFPNPSFSREKAESVKKKISDITSSGDRLLAARQFEALCHKHAQKEATLEVARRDMAGRVIREVKGQMQELKATTHGGMEACAMRSRRKLVEKAALETWLAQLRHATGSNRGDGGKKGGGSGDGRRGRGDGEKQDPDLSQMLGLDDEDSDEDSRDKNNAQNGRSTGMGNASTTSTCASSPIKKRSKTLFVPSPPRGMQSPQPV
ncbi:hypothetical protein VYU27_006170 [Nannochloropsis oceanica]